MKKKILVVEDDRANRIALEVNLSRLGYEVITAVDGRAALIELHNNGIIDLIITDIQMPNMNGWELIDELRQSPLTDKISVIAMSCCDYDKIPCAMWDNSRDIFLTKPYGRENFFSLVAEKCSVQSPT